MINQVSFYQQNKQDAQSVQIIGACDDSEVPKDDRGFIFHIECCLALHLKLMILQEWQVTAVQDSVSSVKPLNILLNQENIPAVFVATVSSTTQKVKDVLLQRDSNVMSFMPNPNQTKSTALSGQKIEIRTQRCKDATYPGFAGTHTVNLYPGFRFSQIN